MSPSTSNSQLAEEFVEFFHTKTEKIRGKFKDIEPYQPRQLDVSLLMKFTPVTTRKDNQRNAIENMSTRYNSHRQTKGGTRRMSTSSNTHNK